MIRVTIEREQIRIILKALLEEEKEGISWDFGGEESGGFWRTRLRGGECPGESISWWFQSWNTDLKKLKKLKKARLKVNAIKSAVPIIFQSFYNAERGATALRRNRKHRY